MAKPGSKRARELANGDGAVDLSAASLTDEQAWALQAKLELTIGKRCMGCGRRIGMGLQFVAIDVTNPRGNVVKLAACNRNDCEFAEECRDGATFMEMVEYAWLDALGLDAPAVEIKRSRAG